MERNYEAEYEEQKSLENTDPAEFKEYPEDMADGAIPRPGEELVMGALGPKVESVLTGLTVILNGTRDFEDPTEKLYKHLVKHGREVQLVDELFDKPHRLRTIADLKPQNLVILTTGMRGPQVNELTEKFMEMGFLPENIVFVLNSTVDFFYGFVNKLKGKVKFWELYIFDMELNNLDDSE